MKILVTGIAGFIGYHLTKLLLEEGHEVIGIDEVNDYYDIELKYGRLSELGYGRDEIVDRGVTISSKYPKLSLWKVSLGDKEAIEEIFRKGSFDQVCHLAAQAGVGYSVTNPHAYVDSNVVGFMNILEGCRHGKVSKLVYASSSSVYGLNESMPFSTRDNVSHPVSLYAATKKSNELMAHVYSHLYELPTVGLRFFTVYGPWGRPDMALFVFTRMILENKPITVYNHGKMLRDFTYIDDIVEGVKRVIENPVKRNTEWSGETPEPDSSKAPYRVYNIGNHNPTNLMDFIHDLENALGKKAEINFAPMRSFDVPATYADVSGLKKDYNFQPGTSTSDGVQKFVDWYREFYKNN